MYRYFGTTHQPYETKECPNCFNTGYILKTQTFCSGSCAKQFENKPFKRIHIFSGTIQEYKKLHARVVRKRGSAKQCVLGCISNRYHWANDTGNYEDVNDYIELCPSCHYRFDKWRIYLIWGPDELRVLWLN